MVAGIANAQGPAPAKVEVAAAEERVVAPTIRLVGTVRPCVRTTVASEIGGLVSSLPIDDGDCVQADQVICKLRALPHQLAHEQAAARLKELTAVLDEREADEEKAAFEARRMSGLWESGRCTEKEFRDSSADHRSAQGRTHQARHAMAAQESVVAALADMLARTEIRAPFAGYVVERFTQIGSWVDEGGPVAELVDLSVARVRVDVPEANIAFCAAGEEATVSVEALDASFDGTISRLIPAADPQARTFPVDVDIPNESGLLKSGMFVRAALPSGPKGTRLVIPKNAVVVRGPDRLVYAVHTSDSGAMATPVPVRVIAELAGRLSDHVAVEAPGIAPGDDVVVRGNEYMFGPGPVTIIGRSGPIGALHSRAEAVAASQPSG